MDWILCPASQFIPGMTLDDAILWHDVRVRIWYTLVRINPETPYSDNQDIVEYSLDINDIEAKTLFSVVPSTFRFPPPPSVNICPDTGYNLKGKLYLFITGDVIPKKVKPESEAVEKKDQEVPYDNYA